MAKTTTGPAQAVRASSSSDPVGVAPDARTAAPAPADPPEVKAQSLSPRARKAAAEKAASTGKPAKGAAPKPARTARGKGVKDPFVHKPKGPDLREDLRAFVQARPSGWGHQDWTAFLDHLRERGHDTSDPEAVGLLLERERLWAALEGVQGMGPRRIQTVVERYDTIWSAHQANVDEMAALPGMNRPLAEKVRQALQG
ncbi:MAG TPA: helix-hairpin-helix domain-containing protein [Longimicrobium sp.]|nr:helix-hairpin-helix domain-containing protein [Longimicrobium sp.]